MKHIVIIGNGISGITTARFIRKASDNEITVTSAETDHFFSRTALMYVYMGHMRYKDIKPYENWFWTKNRIKLMRAYVKEVDIDNKKLIFSDGRDLSYDILVLATGSKSNMFGWPGQELKGVQGLYSFQDLELMEENTKGIENAVIVGGGLIGIEMAEMMQSRNIHVTFLVREKNYWDNILPEDEAKMINRHILEHNFNLNLQTELKEIFPDENGRVRAVITNKGEEIPCQFVGLTVGVSPNIDFLKGSGIETNKGILVNKYLETNVRDVYALGDCVEQRTPLPDRRPIEQVWYTGRMMGETVARTICGNKLEYQPGIWFNSAKFLDIEYQTYGWVWNRLKANEDSFYWEHKDGKKCLRIVFDRDNKTVLGINVLGIRLRHDVCEKWIKEKRSIDYVIDNLQKANFDPEFFPGFEKEIRKAYHLKLS